MSERVLPEGWVETKLGELNAYVSRSFDPKKNPDVACELYSVPVFFDGQPEKVEGKEIGSTKQHVEPGDVLVCKINPRINRVWKVGKAREHLQIASSEWIVVRQVYCDSRYLMHYFQSPGFRAMLCSDVSGVGGSLTRAKPKLVAGYSVPVCSLSEQKAIADKLDELLAQVNNLKARLYAIPAILKRFRQSVLAAAVSGKLTRDFSSDDSIYYQEIEEEVQADTKLSKVALLSADEIELAKALHGDVDWRRWRVYPLSQLVDSSRGIPYGIVQTGDHDEDGIPVIRCGDVEALKISPGELKKVLPSISESYSRTLLRGGEVVLAIRGSVGNATVVPEAMKGNNISREVALIPVIDKVDARYIALVLQSPGGYRCLAEKVKGVAQKGINLSDVRRFVTPLPTLQEQQEIVRRVDQLFAFADQIEQQVKNAQARANKLTQSILAKAFRGDLTAEWRAANPELISGENSAEALLERIKAEKTNQKPVAKQRKQDAVGTAG